MPSKPLQALAGLARSSLLTAVRYEDIAQAPYRLDEHRLGGVWLDQLAQPGDLHVQATVEGFVFATPCKFHEFVAGQRDLGMAGEYLQHRELTRGDGYGLVVLGECTRRQIQHIGAELDGFVFLAWRARVFFRAATTQNGVDAGEQFAGIEGFGQVVVRTHLQPDDAVDLFRLGRENDDGGIVVTPPEATADGQTIFAG